MPDVEAVIATLSHVMDPELNRSIVDLGMVHDLAFQEGVVTFTLALTGCLGGSTAIQFTSVAMSSS